MLSGKIRVLIVFTCFLVFYFLILLKKFSIDAIESTDSYFYLKIAELSYKGESFTHPIYSPGYSWMVSLFLTGDVDTELAGRIISLIFGFGTAILIFLLTIEFFGRRMATHTVLFLFANPLFTWACVSTLPYTAQTFFFWLPLYLIVICRRRGWGLVGAFLAGVVGGYGYVIRPENILSLPAAVIMLRSLRASLFFFLGFLGFPAFYHFISYQEGHLPSIIAKFIGYKIPELKEVPEVRKTSYILEKLVDLPSHLRLFFTNIHLFHKYIIPKILSSSQIIIFGAGFVQIISSWRNIGRHFLRFVIIFLVWVVPIMLLIEVGDYMFIPMLPIFSLICAMALEIQPAHVTKVLKVLVAFSIALSVFQSARPFYKDDKRKIYRIAGEWVRNNLGDNIVIFEPFPFVTFYAKGVWITDITRASLIIISELDYTSARGIPQIMVLPPEKVEFELLKEINYEGVRLRIFKNKLKDAVR